MQEILSKVYLAILQLSFIIGHVIMSEVVAKLTGMSSFRSIHQNLAGLVDFLVRLLGECHYEGRADERGTTR